MNNGVTSPQTESDTAPVEDDEPETRERPDTLERAIPSTINRETR